MTQFLAVYDDAKSNRQCGIYYDYQTFFQDTFSPDCKVIFTLDLSKVAGKTYDEKKANIMEKAIDYSNNTSEIYPISYSELSVIRDFFYKYGKRYGLLKDFRENAIC